MDAIGVMDLKYRKNHTSRGQGKLVNEMFTVVDRYFEMTQLFYRVKFAKLLKILG